MLRHRSPEHHRHKHRGHSRDDTLQSGSRSSRSRSRERSRSPEDSHHRRRSSHRHRRRSPRSRSRDRRRHSRSVASARSYGSCSPRPVQKRVMAVSLIVSCGFGDEGCVTRGLRHSRAPCGGGAVQGQPAPVPLVQPGISPSISRCTVDLIYVDSERGCCKSWPLQVKFL